MFKRGAHFFIFLIKAFFIFASNDLWAEINCHRASGPLDGLHCKVDRSNGGEGSGGSEARGPIKVKFRRMPGFGFHGGITIVDLCQFPAKTPFPSGEVVTSGDDSPAARQVLADLNRPLSCMRKYCSKKTQEVGVALDMLYIPTPLGSGVHFEVGFDKADFKVKCEVIERAEAELEVKSEVTTTDDLRMNSISNAPGPLSTFFNFWGEETPCPPLVIQMHTFGEESKKIPTDLPKTEEASLILMCNSLTFHIPEVTTMHFLQVTADGRFCYHDRSCGNVAAFSGHFTIGLGRPDKSQGIDGHYSFSELFQDEKFKQLVRSSSTLPEIRGSLELAHSYVNRYCKEISPPICFD